MVHAGLLRDLIISPSASKKKRFLAKLKEVVDSEIGRSKMRTTITISDDSSKDKETVTCKAVSKKTSRIVLSSSEESEAELLNCENGVKDVNCTEGSSRESSENSDEDSADADDCASIEARTSISGSAICVLCEGLAQVIK